MVLHRKDRQPVVLHSFDRAIIDSQMSHGDIHLGNSLFIDDITMVLGSDIDPVVAEVLHRMVDAAMAEFQFESIAAECNCQQLMP